MLPWYAAFVRREIKNIWPFALCVEEAPEKAHPYPRVLRGSAQFLENATRYPRRHDRAFLSPLEDSHPVSMRCSQIGTVAKQGRLLVFPREN